MMHVVALSGGKDSTAMALHLAEIEPRGYVYVCTPTGDELPEMFAHWRHLGELLGKPIIPIIGGTLKGQVERWNALPNWRQRWCTRTLKIEPYAAWLMQQPKPITSYVGLRFDEPEREGGDYANVPNVTMRYPMRDWGWSISDVLQYLEQRNIVIPERTDCARCFFQTLGQWWRLWKDHPAIYADAENQETITGYTWRSPQRDTWPTSLTSLRNEFERGHIPPGNPAQSDLFKSMQCRACRM
jgi:3'-phosphoadenosine 5'-phosphosulfate sulfotransferase (PAPS reductase)/FAD synthetase